jgi:glycine/D-amino acid oxidase-like deaminating enzyme
VPDDPPPLDALILGGGIAGLFTLALLRRRGYRAALWQLGSAGGLAAGQTIWSQGIIHGGIKYALTGEASAASREIAAMPERWHAALTGRAEVNLSTVTPLATHQILWTTPGLVSRLAGLAASKAIRTPVERLHPGDPRTPVPFASAPRSIDLYQVAEPVLPVRDVARALAGPHTAHIAFVSTPPTFTLHPSAAVRVTTPASPDGTLPTHSALARRVFFAAGAGNADLLAAAGLPPAAAPMQRRPLHMVMARARPGAAPLPRIFGHCLSASTLPRLTITTSADSRGSPVWLVGGTLAEEGVKRDGPAQAAAARAELALCLPWLDLSNLQLAIGRIDRAEALTPAGARPDLPVISDTSNAAEPTSAPPLPITVLWPTKLAFAPRLAELAAEHLARLNIGPSAPDGEDPAPTRPEPTIAPSPWELAAFT